MAGPEALSQTLTAGVWYPGQGEYVFTPMSLGGYQKAYGDIYSQPEDVFQQPWAAGIESLIPGTLSFTQLITTGRLPLAISGPGGLLTDGFVDGFRSSPDHPARRRAAQNDLLDWTPRATTALCAGSRDPVVTFANLSIAAASFAARGATVTQIDGEQVQAFRTTIDAQVASAPDLSTYHGGIVPPLCASVAKNQIFDPLR